MRRSAIIVWLACMLASLQAQSPVLTFPGGHFLASIPLANTPAQVSVDLLDTRDQVRSHAEAFCPASPCRITLPPATARTVTITDEGNGLSLFRLRYTANGATSIFAVGRIAPDLFELHIAVPEAIRPGEPYVARVRVLHPLTHAPSSNVALTANLTASFVDEKDDAVLPPVPIVTDAEGFASISFPTPADKTLDSINLEVRGTLANLEIGTSQDLRVPSTARFALTADKPLYQPGQTVHTRMLLLDRNGLAQPGTKVQVDVHDPNSTLVFRAFATTSAYGIASVDWPVPGRLRLGQYELEASTPKEDETHESAYASVRLSRYDLPTFTVAPAPDRPFYLPGQNADVAVSATYLFGKPVLHGKVRVVRQQSRTWDFAQQRFHTQESRPIAGRLDAQGIFHAKINLAEDFAELKDRDASNAYNDISLAAYVTDGSSGRTEQRRFDLRVSAQALHVRLVHLEEAAGLPTNASITVTSADGVPARASLRVSLLPSDASDEPQQSLIRRALPILEVATDAHGLARVSLPACAELLARRPAALKANVSGSYDPLQLLITAADTAHRTGSDIEQANEPSGLMRITPERSLLRPGDPIVLTIESAQPSLPVMLQVLRQTARGPIPLATRDLRLEKGQASVTIPSDERFSGLVFLNALALGNPAPEQTYSGRNNDDTTAIASRAILFPRDNALSVAIKMSAESYRPGDQASASLQVLGPQDPDGDLRSAAPSALGLVAVDQAVEERNRTDSESGSSFFFGRSDRQFAGPGGFTAASILAALSPGTPDAERASADLATEIQVASNSLAFEADSTTPTADYAQVFSVLIDAQLTGIRAALFAYLKSHTEAPATMPGLAALGIDLAPLRDPWGEPYTLLATAQNSGVTHLTLRSDGADKTAGTPDDFTLPLAQWRWFAGRNALLQHAVTAFHQRTGQYIRTLADLQAEMKVEEIHFDAWRDPWGQPFGYVFAVRGTSFVIDVQTPGDPKQPRETYQPQGPLTIASASIDYTTELRGRVLAALTTYSDHHPYPRSRPEFLAALRAASIPLSVLEDPWHQPLTFVFRARSFFTDRVHTEAHASDPAATPVTRTTITPVTALSDIIELHSAGEPHRKFPNPFLFATFSQIRSTQSAAESTPRHPSRRPVFNGPAGAIAGTLTDQSGAVIPGALIVAVNLASTAEFEARSDPDGRFLVGPLPAGGYKLHFSMPGFVELTYDQVVVHAKDTVTLDARLSVAAANDTVEVTAQPAMLATSSASVVTVNAEKLTSLPLQAPTKLAKLSFGVLAPPPPPPPPGSATPRLRDYFPETLLWRPEIITAPDGSATVQFPVADSITNWQLSASASTLQGNTGSGSTSFRTFLPFFAAFNPPSILTQGDAISLPITLRNYLDHPVTVSSALAPAPWFRLSGSPSVSSTVPAGDSVSPVFRFTAMAAVNEGKQEFTASGAEAGDRIARLVTVHPDGQPSAVTAAGILQPGATTFSLTLPPDTLPGSAETTLKLYPNFAAHLHDALVAMAHYPDGCAEQIISIAWPSLLLERYADKMKGSSFAEGGGPGGPETPQEPTPTRRNLEQAYENLLGNQQADGGFAYWQANSRSDLALTAYAVQFLAALGPFVAVDEHVLAKAVQYLAGQQQKDGRFVATDDLGKPQPLDVHANAMLTASIAAMIAGATGSEPILRKALAATDGFTHEFDEPYTVASYALAALALHDDARSQPAIARLRTLALAENGGAYWSLETNTPFFGWGRAGRVEATAQVLRALLAAGATQPDDLLTRGLLFLDHEQDRHSLWYSTQASARVLDVLAAIALKGAAPAVSSAPGSLTVAIDGRDAASVPLPPATLDAGPTFVPLGSALAAGAHAITLTLPGSASAATAQLVSDFYRPWPRVTPGAKVINNEQLRLKVAYSTSSPLPGQPVTVTAHMERVGFRGYGMMIAELGLPPGADVDRASLDAAMEGSGYQLNRFEVLPDRVLMYLSPRAGELTLHFRFTLRYAVDALTAPSTLYDYYNPDSRLDQPPVRLVTPVGAR